MCNVSWFKATVAVAMLLLTACGSTRPATALVPASPSIASSPGNSPSASPSPAVSVACTQATRCVLVTLRGSNSYVVRDLTDISHARTLSNLGSIPAPQFVSGAELSYMQDGRLVRAPLVGTPATIVVSSDQLTGTFAWSPDGTAVVYVAQVGSTLQVHELRGTADRTLGTIPSPGAGGCEGIAGCTLPNWLDFRLAFSGDGTSISLVVDSFGVNVLRLWSSSGALLTSSDAQGQTMSAWSGQSLYFRDAGGVRVWRDGTVSSFLPGVAWIKPSLSPGGGQMVYSARDGSGWAHTYVVDTTTRKVRELKAARTDAVFLTPRFIWYQGERSCQPADGCGTNPPIHPLSGKAYIYDLQDGTETESVITGVYDVWPHAA